MSKELYKYVYITFWPKAIEYTFFSSAHGTFSRIDHTLGHKTSLSKFKKIEIISRIFSRHNIMRLETSYKKQTAKIHKYVEAKLNTIKQPMGHWRNKNNKKHLETNENENIVV